MVDDYFDLFKKAKDKKNDFEKLSIKFKELRSLTINYKEEKETERQLYFANSYGFPYLTGIGAYYFNKKSLYFIEINTSFVFSEASIGYNHEILNMFYAGVNAGIFYVPIDEPIVIPHISSELMYKREKRKKQQSMLKPILMEKENIK